MNVRTSRFITFVLTLAIAAAFAVPAVVAAQEMGADEVGITAVEETEGFALGSGDIRQTAVRLVNVALGFLGIIAVIIVLIGGFKYMLTGGNQDKTDEAKKMLVSGLIGLAIVISAWAITTFVVGQLIEAAG